MVWGTEPENQDWYSLTNWQSTGDWGLEGQKPVIFDTLSKTLAAHNMLADHPASHLFLGVDPKTGAPEMFDMARPRSLVIDDKYDTGRDMLQSMVIALKMRPSQGNWPVTVMTNDPNSWQGITAKYPGIKMVSTGGDGIAHLHELPDRNRATPHIIVIDRLADLVRWEPQDESLLSLILNSGAESYRSYVLARRSPTGKQKAENILNGWTNQYGNILEAETNPFKVLILETGVQIFVPEPK